MMTAATEQEAPPPPHDLAAEEAVLGALLIDSGTLGPLIIPRLSTEDFYPEKHRICYRLLGLLQESGDPDPRALLTWLREEGHDPCFNEPAMVVVARLEEAGALATSAAIRRCVDTILLHAARRRLHVEFLQAAYAVRDGAPPAAVTERVTQAMAVVTEHLRPAPTVGLGMGLGQFLSMTDSDPESFIDGLLSDDGGGWIGGEEKLGKSYYATDEAVCLALGLKVCAQFTVPKRRRVFFLEEEDSPRRMRRRLRALLRGHDLDPEDPTLTAELDHWFHIETWSGFKFERQDMVERLERTLVMFEPAVVYIDVLRKVTIGDVNKQLEMSRVLDILDDLRRKYGVIFRILHHYRKAQGFRVSRGSGEIAGAFVLGAWAENSLFFEPMGRKSKDGVRVEIQMKDGAPEPAFLLKMTSDGPKHAPTRMVLTAEAISEKSAIDQLRDQVLQAVGILPKHEAQAGRAGVTLKALATALKRSDRTVRRVLKALDDEGLVTHVGQADSKTPLYGRPNQETL